mmetsp:Transcript_17836/g.29817  ORF Transcript_17836/g.29817 Transcript_17836/m.29817 type:complete len:98 (+) Transcript_17836:58-351(+)
MLPNGSFAVGLVTSFTGVYYMLLTIKNRTEVAKYGSKAELHKFGDFKNFTLARNYDQELSLRLNEKQKNRYTNSEFALMTNKVTAQVSDSLKGLFGQ